VVGGTVSVSSKECVREITLVSPGNNNRISDYANVNVFSHDTSLIACVKLFQRLMTRARTHCATWPVTQTTLGVRVCTADKSSTQLGRGCAARVIHRLASGVGWRVYQPEVDRMTSSRLASGVRRTQGAFHYTLWSIGSHQMSFVYSLRVSVRIGPERTGTPFRSF